jgi:hypothetical protein
MTARRYRRRHRVSYLMVLLVSNLLSDKPPPRIPGKDPQNTEASFCDIHTNIQLKPLKDTGKFYCQSCPGRVFDPPRTGS